MRPFTITTFVLLIALGVAYCSDDDDDSESSEEDSDEHGQFRGEKDTNCTCGWTNKAKGRIVGGKETQANEYPYMTSLVKIRDEEPYPDCGCAIITPRHAITAAHCTYNNDYDVLGLLVGEHNLAIEEDSDYTQFYIVKEKFEHPEYNPKNLDNDIAILFSERRIKFNSGIGPVCLPTGPMNRFLTREKATVKATGWGTLGYNREQSKVLMKVNLKVIPIKRCKDAYPKKTIDVINPIQICTWGEGKDTCAGDSGGPLAWLDPETNRYTLVALVSFGKKLCGSGEPAVNTDVAYHLPWIQQTISSSTKNRMKTCAKEE